MVFVKEILGHFQAVFVVTKTCFFTGNWTTRCFLGKPGGVSSHFCWPPKTAIFTQSCTSTVVFSFEGDLGTYQAVVATKDIYFSQEVGRSPGGLEQLNLVLFMENWGHFKLFLLPPMPANFKKLVI